MSKQNRTGIDFNLGIKVSDRTTQAITKTVRTVVTENEKTFRRGSKTLGKIGKSAIRGVFSFVNLAAGNAAALEELSMRQDHVQAMRARKKDYAHVERRQKEANRHCEAAHDSHPANTMDIPRKGEMH